MSEFISTLWPLLLLFAAFGFFLHSANRNYKQHVEEVNTVNQAIVDTNREMIVELREIKQVLKDRPL